MLSLYRFATELGAPLISIYLRVRKANGKEDAARFEERLGRASRERPGGPLVWAHAASVGEALSLLPLIGRLVSDRPGLEVLVTTGTVTSARTRRDVVSIPLRYRIGRAPHQYLSSSPEGEWKGGRGAIRRTSRPRQP